MRKKDDKKTKKIFKATLKLINYKGIPGLTMAAIAKEAGMATGTLYIYFKSKDELLNALYQTLRKEAIARFFEDVDPKQPYKICLKKVWLNYLNNRQEHHQESLFLEQYYHSPFITSEQKILAEEMKSPVYKLIERGQQEQVIKAFDKKILFSAMLGFIRELVYEHFEGIYELNEKRIEEAFQISWDSIKL